MSVVVGMVGRVVRTFARRGKWAIIDVQIAITNPPPVEVVSAGSIVEGIERATAALKRTSPVVAAAAVQGNSGVRTHRVSIENDLLAIPVRVIVISLDGEN